MSKIVLIIHDVRSSHNVGSMLRTAEGLGVDKVYMTGYTPYPETKNDTRLPHLRRRVTAQIHKTALGAEQYINWQHTDDMSLLLKNLKRKGFVIVALEQTVDSISLSSFRSDEPVALIVGNEIDGIDVGTLNLADTRLGIPMAGTKESFNVSVAASIAMYHLTGK